MSRAGYVSAEPLAGTEESGQRAARGQGGKPARVQGSSAGPSARRRSRQASSSDRDASAARRRLASLRPRPHLCGLQPSRRARRDTEAPEAASRPRSPRGGGPRRTGALRDQPRSVHRPRAGAGWARRGRLGFEPGQGDRLCPGFADVSVYLCVSPVLLSLVTCCHLPVFCFSTRPCQLCISLRSVFLEPIREYLYVCPPSCFCVSRPCVSLSRLNSFVGHLSFCLSLPPLLCLFSVFLSCFCLS